ncbi:hypothetical protein NX059_003246 [Plenodomus lindquistii]|nr:hypothetical protein NX059_003246 [Plenodomus lindquistii]
MASRGAQSIKHQELSNVKVAHSTDLIDICSRIITIRVGGGSDQERRDAEELTQHRDSHQKSAEAIESGVTHGQLVVAGDENRPLTEDVDSDDLAIEKDVKEYKLGQDAPSMEASGERQAAPTEGHAADDLYYLYHTDSDYNSNFDSDYVYEEPTNHNSDIDNESETSEVSESYSERLFHVHQSVLCQYSKFFQAATKPRWSEYRKKPIDLSEDDPDIFALYVQWLYTGLVAVKSKREDTDVEDSLNFEEDDTAIEFQDISKRTLVKCYLLGEKLMDTVYQDTIMSTLLKTASMGIPTYDTIRIAYQGTNINSPLRKLMVDIWVWCGYVPSAKGDLVWQSDAEFANDLIHALLAHRNIAPIDNADSDAGSAPWDTGDEAYYMGDDSKEEEEKN